MTESVDHSLELLHPFYLDTDMSMAFAAAMTGGVAFSREDLERKENSAESTSGVGGGLRLFDLLGINAHKESQSADTVGSESRLVRQHTEASLFIGLHDELKRRNKILDAYSSEVEPGDLVSLNTGPAMAPLRRVLDQIIRLLDMTLPIIDGEQSGHTEIDSEDQHEHPVTRQERRAQARELARAAQVKTDEEDVDFASSRRLFLALREDLDRSGMVDVVVSPEDHPAVVLTLDKRFLDDHALELMHTSRFTVVGKITEVWPDNESVVNLYRRSVMSLVPALGQVATWGIFTLLAAMAGSLDVKQMEENARNAIGGEAMEEGNLSGNEDSEIRLGDDIAALNPAITGPALQILPLAICA